MPDIHPIVAERLIRMRVDLERDGACGCSQAALATEVAIQYRNLLFIFTTIEPESLQAAFCDLFTETNEEAPPVTAERG